MENKFNIDFLELYILATHCIPPAPIARTCFFKNLINVHYHKMDAGQRVKMYKMVKKRYAEMEENYKIIGGMAKDYTDLIKVFLNRYDPSNQFLVKVNHEGKIIEVEAFIHNSRFQTGVITYIPNEMVIESKNIQS